MGRCVTREGYGPRVQVRSQGRRAINWVGNHLFPRTTALYSEMG